MTRSHRSRHRIFIIVLTMVVPVGFVAGILGRKAIPENPTPLALNEIPNSISSATVIFESIWSNHTISTQVFTVQDSSTKYFLQLEPENYLQYPELLLYWHQKESDSNIIFLDAYLLGRLENSGKSIFSLPPECAESDGYLTIYSPARQAIVDHANLALKSALQKGED